MALHRYCKPITSLSSPKGHLRADENISVVNLNENLFHRKYCIWSQEEGVGRGAIAQIVEGEGLGLGVC